MRGNGDPSFSSRPDGLWMAFTTPDGPVTLRLTAAGTGRGPAVDAQAWGPGSAAALAAVPRAAGRRRRLVRPLTSPRSTPRSPGWSVKPDAGTSPSACPSTGRMVDCLVPTILEQKVTVIEARRGYRYLMYRFGHARPRRRQPSRPPGLLVQPTPEQWLRIPSWEWHKAGVGPQRSATVMRALRSAVALERLAALPAAEAAAKMQTIPGHRRLDRRRGGAADARLPGLHRGGRLPPRGRTWAPR